MSLKELRNDLIISLSSTGCTCREVQQILDKNHSENLSLRQVQRITKQKGMATQMWCLGCFLPLLIGHLVPEGDNFWENFLMLLTIMDYVFAHVTTANKADYVAMLVKDFLADFKDLYPDRHLIPKMHYMIHLLLWMKFGMFHHCGHFRRMWCMRYEAKHSYFKHLAHVLGNFKNIAKTLTDHHQQYMCYQMSEPANYLRTKPEYTQGKRVVVHDLDYETELMRAALVLDGDSVLQRVQSTVIDGTTYWKGTVVICGIEDDTHMFGRITELIVIPHQECFFVTSPLLTIALQHNFHAY